jgi:hypothetical protein
MVVLMAPSTPFDYHHRHHHRRRPHRGSATADGGPKELVRAWAQLTDAEPTFRQLDRRVNGLEHAGKLLVREREERKIAIARARRLERDLADPTLRLTLLAGLCPLAVVAAGTTGICGGPPRRRRRQLAVRNTAGQGRRARAEGAPFGRGVRFAPNGRRTRREQNQRA